MSVQRLRFPFWGTVGVTIMAVLLALSLTMVISLVMAVKHFTHLTANPEALETAMRNAFATEFGAVVNGIVLVTCLGVLPIIAAYAGNLNIREAFGFRLPPKVVWLVAPIAILALGPTSDLLSRLYTDAFPSTEPNSLDMIIKMVEQGSLPVLFLAVAVIPGFSEEIFFRGMVQRTFGFGWVAITISAVTFALIHGTPAHIIGVLPLGFLLAWLGARTGSLWLCIFLHTLNNTIAIIAAKTVGMEQASEALPLWAAPLGWLIAAPCVYVIYRATSDREATVGPAYTDSQLRKAAKEAPPTSF